MSINIRAKGQEGEREVARALNEIIDGLLLYHNGSLPSKQTVQRNQNQSAVGGCDLSNVFGLAIEVKRQENLDVNSWWKQTVEQAARNGEFPVLVYRQNRRPWHVVMYGWIQLPGTNGPSAVQKRVTISWKDFLEWFEEWVDRKIRDGEIPRT